MYNITVENPVPIKEGEDPEKYEKRLYVWQNSWGLTTRSIGVMMLIHGYEFCSTHLVRIIANFIIVSLRPYFGFVLQTPYREI
jgi:hypothetical protein